MPDKTKWVNEWKQKAENDLRTAEIVLSSEEPPTDTICFHAQQCAEKYLKSYLTLKDITIEKTMTSQELTISVLALSQIFRNYPILQNFSPDMLLRSGTLVILLNAQ